MAFADVQTDNHDADDLFLKYDKDGDGRLSRADMNESLQSLPSQHHIDRSQDKIGALTDAIFESANADNKDGATGSTLSMSDRNQLTALARKQSFVPSEEDETPKTVLRRVVNYVISYRQQIIWLFLFFAFQIIIFGLGINRYYEELPTSPYPYDVLSMVALSFGLVIEFNVGILLLGPALRWTSGHLRRTYLGKLLPFDSMVNFHIILGCVTLFCGAMHVICFLTHFYNQSLEESTIQMNITLHIILTQQGFLGHDFLGFTAMSGWIMIACFTIMAFFALPPIRNSFLYDAFYWSHKLQFVIWAALVVHTPQFWKFLVFPLSVLFLEKLHKYWNAFRWSGTTRIVQVNLLQNNSVYLYPPACPALRLNVTQLVITRPKDFKYNPGDYVFMKVPCLGVISWHPFTLSSCPEQTDVLWFHIKAVGNWTRELRKYFERHTTESGASVTHTPAEVAPHDELQMQPIVPTLRQIPALNVRVLLDGPYGASTTDLFDTEHAVLIAAGIGVTPFASVLGSVLAQYRDMMTGNSVRADYNNTTIRINQRQLKLRKLDFIWVSREQENVQWFIDLLEGWERQQQSMPADALFMDCQLYITSLPHKKECKVAGLSLGMNLHLEVHKKDVITGLRTATKTGRPDWPSVFAKIDRTKKGSVRVFYCGPHNLKQQLRLLSGQHRFGFSWENF